MNNSFRTYQKSNKFRISGGTILAIIFVGSLLILLLNNELSFLQFNFIEKTFRIVVIIFFVLLVYKIFKSFNETEQLYGKITGSLELFSDKILLNNTSIKITEVNKLELKVNDYDGKREVFLVNTWYPSLSNGFNNIFSINLLNKEKIETNFEQKFEGEFLRKNKEILIDYHKAGKISFINLLDTLGIEDYDEIQKFKKSLKINSD